MGLVGVQGGWTAARDLAHVPQDDSSWAHDKGIPPKVVAAIMGHAKVDTTINVYTQVLDGAVRDAADRVGSELFTIVHNPAGATALTH